VHQEVEYLLRGWGEKKGPKRLLSPIDGKGKGAADHGIHTKTKKKWEAAFQCQGTWFLPGKQDAAKKLSRQRRGDPIDH